jgi:hypothetical protein
MTKKEILGLATTLWGEINQRNQLQEELTELDLAICKLRRTGNEEKKMDNFFEEIADVKIMIEQMEFIYGTKEINNHYENKLQRLEGRVQENLQKIPCYCSMKVLHTQPIISKYFNQVITPDNVYLLSKDSKFSIFDDNIGYRFIHNSNNLNNEKIKLYEEIVMKHNNITFTELSEFIKLIYNDKKRN